MSAATETFELQEIRGPSAFGGGARRTLDLLWLTSVTDFRVRYSNTGLGYAWSVLKPFLFFGIIYVVVNQVLQFSGSVPNYAAMLVLNLVIFQYFQEATGAALRSIPSKEPLVRKMQFPRIVIPLAVSLTAVISLLFNLLGIFLLFIVAGIGPSWTWLLLPLVVVVLVTFSTGLVLMLSVLNVRSQDVGQAWTLIVRALFYATPILYPIDLDAIPETVQKIMIANPLAPLMEQARIWVVDSSAPTTVEIAGWFFGFVVPMLVVIATCVIGFQLFEREAPRVAEAL